MEGQKDGMNQRAEGWKTEDSEEPEGSTSVGGGRWADQKPVGSTNSGQ